MVALAPARLLALLASRPVQYEVALGAGRFCADFGDAGRGARGEAGGACPQQAISGSRPPEKSDRPAGGAAVRTGLSPKAKKGVAGHTRIEPALSKNRHR